MRRYIRGDIEDKRTKSLTLFSVILFDPWHDSEIVLMEV